VETQAKELVPVDTGNLKGSITHRVDGDAAIVGTNVEYAEHVEYGTSRMAERSYLRAAIDAMRKKLTVFFKQLVQEEVRKRGRA
jgi:phage gpG-like protein